VDPASEGCGQHGSPGQKSDVTDDDACTASPRHDDVAASENGTEPDTEEHAAAQYQPTHPMVVLTGRIFKAVVPC